MLNRAAKPAYPLNAVPVLLEAAAQVVLLAKWGELDPSGIQLKKPAHTNWQKQHPGYMSIKQHIDQSGLLGIVPDSLGLAVLDVDRGNASQIMAEFPPFFVTPSRRPGGMHIWYPNPSNHTTPRKWQGPGNSSGEVVAGPGKYAVLWHSALGDLAWQLEYLPVSIHAADFRDVVNSLTWIDHLGRPAEAFRGIPAVNVDLSQALIGSRNSALFSWLLKWGYDNHQTFQDFSDFLDKMINLGLAGRDQMPDLGPSPRGGEAFEPEEAIKVARSAARRVWRVKRQPQDSLDHPRQGKGLESALSPPDFRQTGQNRPVPRVLANWSGGTGEMGYRGDPALNADSEVQRRRRAKRTEYDRGRVQHRRQVVARRFVLGQDVATISTAFGVTPRLIQRDLAQIKNDGALPSRRQARRAQQAQQDTKRRRAETTGSRHGYLGSGNLAGLSPTSRLSSTHPILDPRENRVTTTDLPTAIPPPPQGTGGMLPAAPRVNGLVSLSRFRPARDGPPWPEDQQSSVIRAWVCRGCGWSGPDLDGVQSHIDSVLLPERDLHRGWNVAFNDAGVALKESEQQE